MILVNDVEELEELEEFETTGDIIIRVGIARPARQIKNPASQTAAPNTKVRQVQPIHAKISAVKIDSSAATRLQPVKPPARNAPAQPRLQETAKAPPPSDAQAKSPAQAPAARQPAVQKTAPPVRQAKPAPRAAPPLKPDAQETGIKARLGNPAITPDGGVYYACAFPVIMFDADFKIVYTNPAAKTFFSSYFNLSNKQFFDLFGKYFTFEDVRGIREAVLKGKDGSSWKGKAEIKSRNNPKIFTRVYLFPADRTPKGGHSVWTVVFDDVTEENKTLLRSVFISLLEASKLKDNDTGKHITRVNYYSEALAKRLFNRPGYNEVDAEFIDNIGFLAAMHDVGKIGTPDDVLNKQGPLSDWEWSVMKEHTKNGAFILSTYPNPMAKEIAQSHHEKWNGKGYPFGIDGKSIPLAARIVAVADVYDALRMQRSYKPPFSHDVALEKITADKGSHFDPELIDIFLEMSEEFNSIYEINKDA
ncbi:MAG: HD domain-containing protein [Spirochaetaceae bacterium]|nr:HD domain-containing protein [Spirochaetaceae bacterium]